MFKFAQHGQSGTLGQRAAAAHRRRSPTTSRSSSRCTPRRSTTTRRSPSSRPARQQPGRPSLGAWLSYGLGSENENLPAFVVLISQGSGNKTDQPLFSRLWGSGFLPTEHQGVRFRSGGDPVLYLSNPPGIDADDPPADARRPSAELNQLAARVVRRPGDQHPHRPVRDGLPHADVGPRADRPLATSRSTILDLYGLDDTGVDGGFARNCLLARRLVERGVRFVQLIHRGWDQHSNLPTQIRGQCQRRRPARPPR